MRTSADRLQFAVRFAQLDLGTLRAGDWLNLREDAMAFLGTEPKCGLRVRARGMVARPRPPFPRDWTTEDFQALQGHVRSILDGWVGPAHPEEPCTVGPHTLDVHYSVMCLHLPSGDLVPFLLVQGGALDLFRFTLLHLLAQETTNAVRRCPECQAIFYRVGKQRYCTRKCSNQANVRTWRERQEVQQAEAERAHERYVAKKKKQVGERVVVQRKRRKGGLDVQEGE